MSVLFAFALGLLVGDVLSSKGISAFHLLMKFVTKSSREPSTS